MAIRSAAVLLPDMLIVQPDKSDEHRGWLTWLPLARTDGAAAI